MSDGTGCGLCGRLSRAEAVQSSRLQPTWGGPVCCRRAPESVVRALGALRGHHSERLRNQLCLAGRWRGGAHRRGGHSAASLPENPDSVPGKLCPWGTEPGTEEGDL